jgi:hypothetical protein
VTARPEIAVCTWARNEGHARDIAGALDADFAGFARRGSGARWVAPLRWITASVRMTVWLARRRPRRVVVSNPPIFAPLIGWLYCVVARGVLAIDSHPASFGASGDIWGRFLWLHAFISRRARVTLVAADQYAELATRWGGRPLVLHEPPPTWTVAPPAVPGPRPRVLFVTVFDADEPIDAIVDAAGALDDCDVVITGDTRRAPAGVVARARKWVTFSGWLDEERFVGELEKADVVVCLTSSPHAVLRSASEARYAQRVTVMSDQPALREAFAPAVFCTNDAPGIVAGVRQALREHDEWRRRSSDARDQLLNRWDEQRRALERRLLGVG